MNSFSNNGWGGRQAELLVAQQAQALLNDEHKALPPAQLQSLVKDLLNSSPYYSEAVRQNFCFKFVQKINAVNF